MVTHSLFQERENFELFLNRKGLSQETIKVYLIYLEKLVEIMKELESDLTQQIMDAFLDAYSHVVSRAFLKNYLEYKQRRDLFITRRTGRTSKKETSIIPEHELELIRTKLYEHKERDGLIFDLSINCALRRQEVLNIKAEDIKVEQDDKMFILIRRGKGNKERMVFVPKEIALLVIHYCFNNNLTPADYLFKSPLNSDKPIDKTIWNKAFTIASMEAIGKKYHPHQLRHTRATEWFEKGIDIVRIQQRLGHSNIATTRLYLNPDNKKELEKWSNEDKKEQESSA